MLLSPDRPSLAAALLGTTDGVEDVAAAVAVEGISTTLTDDVLVTMAGVSVVMVVPDWTTVVSFRVQVTVETALADVEGSVHEVEEVFETSLAPEVLVIVTVFFAVAEVAALRAARRREERILEEQVVDKTVGCGGRARSTTSWFRGQ